MLTTSCGCFKRPLRSCTGTLRRNTALGLRTTGKQVCPITTELSERRNPICARYEQKNGAPAPKNFLPLRHRKENRVSRSLRSFFRFCYLHLTWPEQGVAALEMSTRQGEWGTPEPNALRNKPTAAPNAFPTSSALNLLAYKNWVWPPEYFSCLWSQWLLMCRQ